jgi:hypothetical protein
MVLWCASWYAPHASFSLLLLSISFPFLVYSSFSWNYLGQCLEHPFALLYKTWNWCYTRSFLQMRILEIRSSWDEVMLMLDCWQMARFLVGCSEWCAMLVVYKWRIILTVRINLSRAWDDREENNYEWRYFSYYLATSLLCYFITSLLCYLVVSLRCCCITILLHHFYFECLEETPYILGRYKTKLPLH